MVTFIELDDVRKLASITDEYLCDREHSYEKHLEEIILEYPDPQEALIEFFVDLLLVPADVVEESIRLFMDIPLDQMPKYLMAKPLGHLRGATSPCPSSKEGPYLWQMLLAQWRIRLQF
jgi:hypothetical protein